METIDLLKPLLRASVILVHSGARHLSLLGLMVLVMLKHNKECGDEMNMSELSLFTNIPRSTMHKTVEVLMQEGYVSILTKKDGTGGHARRIPKLTGKGTRFVKSLLK